MRSAATIRTPATVRSAATVAHAAIAAVRSSAAVIAAAAIEAAVSLIAAIITMVFSSQAVAIGAKPAVIVEAAESVMEMVVAMKAAESVMKEMVVIVKAVEAVMEPEAVEIKRPVVGRIPVVEVAPWPNADEHSVYEIAWAPVTVGCAGIRIVRIKPVFAHRRRIVEAVARPDLDAERNLCL